MPVGIRLLEVCKRPSHSTEHTHLVDLLYCSRYCRAASQQPWCGLKWQMERCPLQVRVRRQPQEHPALGWKRCAVLWKEQIDRRLGKWQKRQQLLSARPLTPVSVVAIKGPPQCSGRKEQNFLAAVAARQLGLRSSAVQLGEASGRGHKETRRYSCCCAHVPTLYVWVDIDLPLLSVRVPSEVTLGELRKCEGCPRKESEPGT